MFYLHFAFRHRSWCWICSILFQECCEKLWRWKVQTKLHQGYGRFQHCPRTLALYENGEPPKLFENNSPEKMARNDDEERQYSWKDLCKATERWRELKVLNASDCSNLIFIHPDSKPPFHYHSSISVEIERSAIVLKKIQHLHTDEHWTRVSFCVRINKHRS